MKQKTVLVSGGFDFLYRDYIAFLKTAASYGKLYVAVNQDKNLLQLRGKASYFSEKERVYLVGSVKYVHEVFISSGLGVLDFEPDIRRINPDIFIVNEDGDTPEKKRLCEELGVEYIVLKGIREKGLPVQLGTNSRQEMQLPYRLCLAGGWMDQPWVSELCPGSVVVAQIWPTMEFNNRSGMATSSRKIALELWGGKIPEGDPIRNAKLLFGAENPPGSEYISGSQDQIGLLVSGINRLYYDGKYWPANIESCIDPSICDWLSEVLYLIPLDPRPAGYDPIREKHLERSYIKELGTSGDECWESILKKEVEGLGQAMTKSFLAWGKILPNTVPDYMMHEMETKYFPNYAGAITSGCGGGYIIVASEKEIEGAIRIKVKY